MYSKFILIILSGLFIITGCKLKTTDEQKINLDSLQYYSYMDKKNEKIYYRFPSTEEVFDIINHGGLQYNPDLVNPITNVDKYNDSRIQAINLGIYTADLAYLTVFEKTKESLDYFEVLQQLSNKLHITSSVNDNIFNRIENNLNNIDSLKILAKDSYNNIVEHFSVTENEKTLAIITAGAYVECLYISCHLIKTYSNTNKAITKLAEQKYALENLFQYIKNFEDYPYVKETLAEIENIFTLYASLKETEMEETSVTEAEDGSLIFAGGKIITMSERQFIELKQELAKIRTQYITP